MTGRGSPSETELLILQIDRELRAKLDPEGVRGWKAMVDGVFDEAPPENLPS